VTVPGPWLVRRLAVLAIVAAAGMAHADEPDAKREVVVLEYRAGSAALPAIAERITTRLRALTSLRVIDTNAARQKVTDLDDAVVKCSGESDCLAVLGQKIGADEIILVGISELGDVILTLQRITPRRGEVETRIAESLAPSDAPADAVLAQYLARLMPPSDFIRFGTIDVVANLGGASVLLGGKARGTTPIKPLRVRAPARYDIRVEKSGYVPFAASVAVPPDGEVTVKAQLTRRGAGDRWYQKWWVIGLAGGAVVGATGAAIYIGTRIGDSVPVGGVLD
jgi:hypothetical protein